MPSTGLKGSYSLTTEKIDEIVTNTSPGAYALGRYDSEEKTFYISYVGRSDNDINDRLKKHATEGKYSRFKFDYYDSPKAAFEKECNLYHDFGEKEKLDNKKHPQRPDDSTWECPRCDIFS